MNPGNQSVLLVRDGEGVLQRLVILDVGSTSTPNFIMASSPYDVSGVPLFYSDNPGIVVGIDAVVSGNFSRPTNTTAYASGQLVANSLVAGSVVPMILAVSRSVGVPVRCARARLLKSTTTTTNAIFRAHIYRSLPSPSNGDGANWLTAASGYVGSFTFDFTGANARVFTDGAKVNAVPDVGSSLLIDPAANSVNCYALLEARGAYAPGNAEVFTLALEVSKD